MFIAKTSCTPVLVLISALSLAGCESATVEQLPGEKLPAPAQPAELIEITATFASPADAEAAVASLERLHDGSAVLAFVDGGASFDARVTESAVSRLIEDSTLVTVDRWKDGSVSTPADEEPQYKNFSCVGYCGGESPGGCFCDSWCWVFGDCCPDYFDVC